MNSREPRIASGGQTTRKHASLQTQRTSHKPRPPAEALQMARILEDSKLTTELNTKVLAVLAVVPGCSEEQIHLALHDNGYDMDKAISALLDSDGQSSQGEWTTTGSRKARKKGATGDCEESGQSKNTSGRASSRAASSTTRESGSSSGRGRTQASRAKSQSSSKRTKVGESAGDQRRSRPRDKERSQSAIQQATPSKVNEEWDILPLSTGDHGTCTSRTSAAESWSDVWQSPLTDQNSDTKQYWEPGDTGHQDGGNESQPIFPEAIPGQDQLYGTPSEITPCTNSGERESVVLHTQTESREKVSRKQKRLARSQIPTKPVEMPAGIESLELQFGELGIDFVGLESSSPSSSPKELPVGDLQSCSDLQQRFGENSVSGSMSTSSSSGGTGGEHGSMPPLEPSPYRSSSEHPQTASEGERELRSPPGLPHPDQQQQQQQQPGDSASVTLAMTTKDASTTIETQLHLQEVTTSSTLKPTPVDHRQSNPPQTTSIPFPSVTTSGAEKLMFSTSPSVTPSMSSSVAASTQHHQHLTQQQGKPSVPPGMVYPHMMPAQYPFIPAPAVYNYDSSGSMAYFPTSTDPLGIPSRDHTSSFQDQRGSSDLSSAVAVSSTQQNQQSASLQHQQQPGGQQMGQMAPTFMGTHFFYPTMYGPMPAFSQAANFGMSYEEMVAAAAGAPASHDYSKMYAGNASSLSKPTSLSASSSVAIDTSTLPGPASSSFKHLESGKPFNYAGVGGSQGGYYMQMPFPHMMVGPSGHEVGGVTPHSRIAQQKHSNKVGGGGYQGNSSTASYWGSTTAHTS